MIVPRPRYEFLMNAMFKDNGKVAFKNIEPTEMELAKLEIPQKDITEDERSVDSDDEFQNPPSKKIKERSNKKQKLDSSTPVAKKPSGKKQVNIVDVHTQMMTPPHRAAKAAVMKTPVFKPIPTRQTSSSKIKEGKQTTRVIFLQVQSKTDSHVEEVAMSKHTEVEAQQMDYAGVETSPQQFSPTVDQNLDENQDGTKITDEKLDDTNLSDSQFIIPDELLPSLNAYRRESITRHPLANSKEEQIDKYFNDKKFESVVQYHCQKNKENVGSCSKADMHREVDLVTEEQIMKTTKIQELTTDEQRDETVLPDSQDIIPDDLLPSLNVYSSKSIIVHPSANCELQTPIPKLRIRPPSKFKESPYMMKFGSAAERCIFLYDSYELSGHYSVVLDVIEKLVAIIPLWPEHCDFYVKKGIHVEHHPRYKDKDSSDIFDVLFQESLPQQPSESLDCGVCIVTYAECLSYGHKILANKFDPNAVRTRYAALLWDYETRKQDVNAHSDVEAPLRPPRQSRITSVTEVFDV
ncbi:hypothetical protein FXO38_02783 [Capsicum annuum]|nr:hypothetical protein FXO38_02783 [Capsicum annuum]